MTMPWFIKCKKPDTKIQDDKGYTLAMHWILDVKTYPPKWMRHDSAIQDYLYRTCDIY